MKKLIFSSPIPSKTPQNSHLPLSPIARFDAGKLRFLPLSRPDSRPLASLFSKQDDPSRRLAVHCSKRSDFATDPPTDRPPAADPFVESAAGGDLDPLFQKAISAGAVILLSAVIGILIQPIILAPPTYATVQTAAKTGGSAAAVVGGRFVRSELLSSAWTGFFAGCLHTLSGPDHLAALAPLSIGRTRMESAAVGALWGCGHDAGQVIFGLLFLLLKDRLHIEVIRTWGTRVVGMTLLVIGAMGIREVTEVPAPCVALENGDCEVGVVESLETPAGGKKKIGFATFATGIVHGLQPDALMMVLPALALPSRLAGAAFLGMFLVGTVIAMGSYTVFIGSCSQALKDRIPRITEKLTWGSSLIAIALGVAILISQFFGFSLY
ncbi:Nickel/cobalt transporter, high-affinity [Cinnamomum micranthum f. kanehirae]|uniref:Nickel/cobalt transporter, high-affinity n=1 Tax=Cinnamomum micranthum f. kanehirae TaxID=337451 RepID=A0A3S3MKH5_9MAGN|nr:Nickel/cobalt transporter, high-affinity [Cinnamomum micranthum f. kanehirae]